MKSRDASGALDGRAVLIARVEHELAELRQLDESLAALDGSTDVVDMVRGRFQKLVGEHRNTLRKLADSAADPPLPVQWETLARIGNGTRPIKREALSFIHGVLFRRDNLDHGVGAVADALAQHLLEMSDVYRRVLVSVAETEFIERTVSMLRLRFPDTTVWGLPIFAHEVGHHVEPALSSSDPAERYGSSPAVGCLEEETQLEIGETRADRRTVLPWLKELFADVYATYALGPAYPLCVITLRAVPDDFDSDLGTHPSWSRRVWTMAAAFDAKGQLADRSGEKITGMAYRDIGEHMARLWSTISGQRRPDGAQGDRAARQAGKMVEVLDRCAFPALIYDTNGPVARLRSILTGPDDDAGGGTALGFGDAPGIVHVLAAAWQLRAENEGAPASEIDRINRHALRLCRAASG